MKNNKKPRAAFSPKLEKVPRATDFNSKISATNFCWRVEEIDWEGPWGWRNATVDVLLQKIIPKLHNFESMTWGALDGPSGSHSVNIEGLCDEAQKRLLKLRKDEQGALYSLRITGKMRVWGIRDRAIFRVLWFDPRHEVCPSLKKHT
ncbi:MAG: hypothetical protein AAGF48_06150 [Pseudomonadota bacterium]